MYQQYSAQEAAINWWWKKHNDTLLPPDCISIDRVLVILCSSRGGSTVFKEWLASSPDVVALAGEVEPYLTLTRNGFPWSSTSDHIEEGTLRNVNILRSLILSELLSPNYEARLDMQFPMNEEWDQHLIDGNPPEGDNPEDGVFLKNGKHRAKIEEPPFIAGLRPPQDPQGKTLVVKTPQDVYRPNMYETIFPEATVEYLHLTRNPAASINGLYDGWISNRGFYSHLTSGTPVTDNDWWKFDMPPAWFLAHSPRQNYADHNDPQRNSLASMLYRTCRYQWMSAHNWALRTMSVKYHDKLDQRQVKFESVLQHPGYVAEKIKSMYGLREPEKSIHQINAMQAVTTPKPKRWETGLINDKILADIKYNQEMEGLYKCLGYNKDVPSHWI